MDPKTRNTLLITGAGVVALIAFERYHNSVANGSTVVSTAAPVDDGSQALADILGSGGGGAAIFNAPNLSVGTDQQNNSGSTGITPTSAQPATSAPSISVPSNGQALPVGVTMVNGVLTGFETGLGSAQPPVVTPAPSNTVSNHGQVPVVNVTVPEMQAPVAPQTMNGFIPGVPVTNVTNFGVPQQTAPSTMNAVTTPAQTVNVTVPEPVQQSNSGTLSGTLVK